MQVNKIAATAAMVTASVGLAMGTAHGEAGLATIQSSGGGVGYSVSVADGGQSISTLVDGGTFSLANGAVLLRNNVGAAVSSIPLRYTAADGQLVSFDPQISADGRGLTMNTGTLPLHQVGGNCVDEIQRAAGGALVGAVIGFLVGFFFLFVGAFVGAVAGAAIGLVVAGGPALADACLNR